MKTNRIKYKITKWFEMNWGWFFTNGRKQDVWARHLKKNTEMNSNILFCNFDHNGECLICDCWPDSCGYLRYMNQDYKWETREQLQEMFKNEKMTKLGLINYEGDCLKAIKEDGEILIQDQYGSIVQRFDVPQFYGFIDGLINVVDSKGKSWNYPRESKDAKPSYSMIYHFVKDIK